MGKRKGFWRRELLRDQISSTGGLVERAGSGGNHVKQCDLEKTLDMKPVVAYGREEDSEGSRRGEGDPRGTTGTIREEDKPLAKWGKHEKKAGDKLKKNLFK